jgi:hypothetical protein
MTRLANLKVKIFAYGAAKAVMLDAIGCQVITVTQDILKKLPLVRYDLNPYSLDREYVPARDAVEAGLSPGP